MSAHAAPLDRARPPAPGPLRPFHFPPVHHATLGNGLAVVVCEVRSFPVATLDLVLPHASAMAEPAERGGLSSLTAALLESGAGGRSAAEIAEAVDGLGLSMDTGTSWDAAQVGLTGLRARLEAGAELVADLVRRPAFPEDEVQRLRAQRVAALRQSRTDPAGLASEMVSRCVFAEGSPFGRPISGLESTVSTLTRQDVAAFHAARYRPAGATVVVAGDVGVDEALALVERHFGDWTGAPEPVSLPDGVPREGGRRIVVADRPGAVQSALRVGHVGIPRSSPDYFPVTVANAVLGGMFASRLNMNLRERLGYTYGASSGFVMRRRRGVFVMQTAVQTEVTAHAVSEMLRELRGMRDAPVTPAELDDARAYLAGSFPLGLQTTEGIASKLVTQVVYGLPRDFWDTYRERVHDVTAEDVLAAARERLLPDDATVVVAGDAAAVAPALEALDEGPVSVVDPSRVLD